MKKPEDFSRFTRSGFPILRQRINAMNANRKQQGIALVTVLGIAVVILALLMVITNLSIRGARITSRDVTSIRLLQSADGYSDWARLTLAANYTKSNLSLSKWIGKITPNINAIPQVINPTDPLVVALGGIHERTLDGATVRWRIQKITPPKNNKASVVLASSAIDSSGNTQTVLRTVWFGDNDIFNLALLSERVDCMFCHLSVKGDVGSLDKMRPGWGSEGGTELSGKGSIIDGDVYSAKTVTKDKAGVNDINGAILTAGKTLNENYAGTKLPLDANDNPAFPGLDRDTIKGNASGSIQGGNIVQVAAGSTWTKKQTASGGISKFYDGNLVLEGTPGNPIVLNGDVYVSGDVVIKGVVTGRGAIYSGRNMYVAGNLTNLNKADKPGTGICSTIADDDAGRNACAVLNIKAGRDETRLSAGNNMILGDYTENDASGNKASIRDRQSAEYYRSQFGLTPGTERYVKTGSSEELQKKLDGTFVDQMGRTVASGDVKTYGTGSDDPYRPIVAPGFTDSSGQFQSWLSDAEYQGILGSESLPNNTWRSGFPDTLNKAISNADKAAEINSALEAAGLPVGSASTQAIADLIVSGAKNTLPFKGTDKNGKPVSGSVYYDGSTLRVAVNEAQDYRAEVTALDGFLYANSRIAGKLSPRGGYINGGMIARQIGVLAPGRNEAIGWWVPDPERAAFNTCDRTARPTDSKDDASNIGTNCNYSINYDYRLRNGGYGYNYYRGVTGATLEWKLDPDGTNKVIP
jgi:hypothetical protein